MPNMHSLNRLAHITPLVAPLALALFCGAAVTASQPSQNTSKPSTPSSTRQAEPAKERALCYFSSLKGTDITNTSGDTVADIRDLVYDRFSGAVAAVVVDADGDRVLDPGAIRAVIDPDGTVKLTTSLSAAEINAHQEFDASAFDPKNSSIANYQVWWRQFDDNSTKWATRGSNSGRDREWAERAKSREATRLEGEVVSLYRIEGERGAYRTIATVREQGGQTRSVVLGPTWYLSDQLVLPVRGQKVVVTVFPIESVDGADWAASQIAVDGGQTVDLRTGNDFAPAWGATTKDVLVTPRRLVLASNIVGDTVRCREDFSGDIENVVVDLRSNQVLAYVVDPNENFLGMGDTKRLIPLSVSHFAKDGEMFIDASKDMIVNSPAAPDKLNDLNNAWNIDQVFEQRPISLRR